MKLTNYLLSLFLIFFSGCDKIEDSRFLPYQLNPEEIIEDSLSIIKYINEADNGINHNDLEMTFEGMKRVIKDSNDKNISSANITYEELISAILPNAPSTDFIKEVEGLNYLANEVVPYSGWIASRRSGYNEYSLEYLAEIKNGLYVQYIGFDSEGDIYERYNTVPLESNEFPYEGDLLPFDLEGIGHGFSFNEGIGWEANFQSGLRHGKTIWYFTNGQIDSHEEWVLDKLISSKSYTYDGEECPHGGLSNGSGKYTWYYENGQIGEISNYFNGDYHGESITFNENGTTQSKEYYINGKIDGRAIYYDDEGIYEYENYYENGELIN